MFRPLRNLLFFTAFFAIGCGTAASSPHLLNGRWELVSIDDKPVAGTKPVIEVSKTGAIDVVSFDSSALGEVTKDDLASAFKDNKQPDGIKIEKFQKGAKMVFRTQANRLLEFRKQDG